MDEREDPKLAVMQAMLAELRDMNAKQQEALKGLNYEMREIKVRLIETMK